MAMTMAKGTVTIFLFPTRDMYCHDQDPQSMHGTNGGVYLDDVRLE